MYCDYISVGWLESRKGIIRSIETRSLEIISPKCSLTDSTPLMLDLCWENKGRFF